jgi:phage tail sheath protein FI
MPQYFTPGVYVEEIERGPRPIEGVATSTAAFLGETERGPTLPRLVGSYNEYTRWFGTHWFRGVFDSSKFMPYAAFGFFDNGGRQLYVCRIVHRADGEASATHNFGGLHVAATGSGDWGNRVWVSVHDSTTRKVVPGHTAVRTAVTLATGTVGADGNWTLTGTTGTGQKWTGTGTTIAGVLGVITIVSGGDYTVDPTLAGDAIVGVPAGGGAAGPFTGYTATLTMQATLPVGINLVAAYWSVAPAAGLFDPLADTTTTPRPQLVETFADVWLDPASPDFFDKRVNGNSALVVLSRADTQPSSTLPPLIPAYGASALSGGVTSATGISSADYTGDDPDPSQRIGLAALLLDNYRDVALLYSPNAPVAIVKELIAQCELQKFRFTVVDSPSGMGDIAAFDPRTTLSDTEYAALYYPWIYISDPQSGARVRVPPGGHVLGVYARTDTNRGVYKAPANEALPDVIDLEFKVDDNAQATLNPRGVNAIRNLPGRGIRVWGARTLSSNTLWKYVPVRRLFIFLERSIYEGTQWVVFEPNDERLWARVKDTIRLFLRTQWREGALMGTTEDQAFQIACDRTTMTQDDILNGRLIVVIGIAPVRPAEFVVFRIFQNTAEAQT